MQQSEPRLRVQYGRALSPRLRKCLAPRISLERPLSLAVRRVASPALRSRLLAGRLARVVRTRSRPHRMRLAPTVWLAANLLGVARSPPAWSPPHSSAELAPHCARRQGGGGGGGAMAKQSGPAKAAPSGAFPPDRKLARRKKGRHNSEKKAKQVLSRSPLVILAGGAVDGFPNETAPCPPGCEFYEEIDGHTYQWCRWVKVGQGLRLVQLQA